MFSRALGSLLGGVTQVDKFVTPERSRRQGREETVACVLAAAARLGADAAVLHAVLGMILALVSTEPARLSARLEERAGQRRVEGSLAGQDGPGRGADIGAVQVETDTADERLNVLLTEAGVSARSASLGAIEAGADTLGQRAQVHG